MQSGDTWGRLPKALMLKPKAGVGREEGLKMGGNLMRGLEGTTEERRCKGRCPLGIQEPEQEKIFYVYFLGMVRSWLLILKVIKSHERPVSRGIA